MAIVWPVILFQFPLHVPVHDLTRARLNRPPAKSLPAAVRNWYRYSTTPPQWPVTRDLLEQGMGAAAQRIFPETPSRSATTSLEISRTSLVGISNGVRSSADDLIDDYGPLVWALANSCTDSTASAEEASVEIFACLFRNAANFDPNQGSEAEFVHWTAARCILRKAMRDRKRI